MAAFVAGQRCILGDTIWLCLGKNVAAGVGTIDFLSFCGPDRRRGQRDRPSAVTRPRLTRAPDRSDVS